MNRILHQSPRFAIVGAGVIAPERIAPTIPDEDVIEKERVGGSGWIVIVFNNEVNTWDEVVMVLQKATGCTQEEADIETWEIDTLGKSVVHHGGQEECERAAGIIRTIGIQVEVVEE